MPGADVHAPRVARPRRSGPLAAGKRLSRLRQGVGGQGHRDGVGADAQRIRRATRARGAGCRESAAHREYELLHRLSHPGIVDAQAFHEHELGPAIVFERDPSEVGLDQFIAQAGPRLDLDDRLALVRQLAEALASRTGGGSRGPRRAARKCRSPTRPAATGRAETISLIKARGDPLRGRPVDPPLRERLGLLPGEAGQCCDDALQPTPLRPLTVLVRRDRGRRSAVRLRRRSSGTPTPGAGKTSGWMNGTASLRNAFCRAITKASSPAALRLASR